MQSATAMPPIKIMGLHEKKENPAMDFPFFGALAAADVPI